MYKNRRKEPPIKLLHVVVGLIIVAVALFSISNVDYEKPRSIIIFYNASYYAAIFKYDISPYATKNCLTLTKPEKEDFVVRKDINSISASDSWDSECSVYSRSVIEYSLVCINITNEGWRDNCGVLSSEAWKKLSGANYSSS